jgi:hypothetical protein
VTINKIFVAVVVFLVAGFALSYALASRGSSHDAPHVITVATTP